MRALGTLLLLGAAFGADLRVWRLRGAGRQPRGAALQARFLGDITVGRTGAWLKDREPTRNYSVNVGALGSDGTLNHVHLRICRRHRAPALDHQG